MVLLFAFGLWLGGVGNPWEGTSPGTVSAQTVYPKLALTLDGKPFMETVPTYRIEDSPAVAVNEFAKAIGAQSTWFPETQEIALYRSNNYFRLKLGTDQAQYNGYPITLDFAPATIDKTIYAPLLPLAKAFSLSVSKKDQTIEGIALFKRDTTRYYTLNEVFLESRFFSEFNYELALPYGWELLSENTFGLKDELDDYSLRLGTVSLDSVKASDLKSYLDLLKRELEGQYGSQLTFKGEGTLAFQNNAVEFLSYQLVQATGERYYETFLVQRGTTIYTFDASFPTTADMKFLNAMYRDIMSTLTFPSESLMREGDHYREYSPFISLGIQFTTPVQANIEVKNYVNFTGSIEHVAKVSRLYAIVTKDNQSLRLAIPLGEDGSFVATLHTPFGSGKHNFTLLATPADGSADQTLLEFSALNLSNRITRYRIPTKHVQSDDKSVVDLAAQLTGDRPSSYFKARALFNWVVETIKPQFGLPKKSLNLSLNPPRPLSEILAQKKATPLEYNLLLAGLLRSISYEAKVMSAKRNGQLSFFVEAYINGKWVVMDPVSAVLAEEYPHLKEITPGATPTPINQFNTYNYMPLLDYQSLFDALQEVE